VRVYPDGIVYNRYGKRLQPTHNDINNFINHQKFYEFVAQFICDDAVVDVGCGSGHGCVVLDASGASSVYGADISKSAIAFARKHFGHLAEFTIQSITDLSQYPDNTFGLTVSSEVLEHIREYGKESQAISELERITRPGGIIVIGTPNSELIDDHGFDYYEMNSLLSDAFGRYCIFENALVPFGANRTLWEKRLAGNDTGIIVSQDINLSETVLPKNIKPELKQGIEAGTYQLGELVINTALLHNTHSWIGVAIKED
jgi:SAM-dependent methyltransferase